jgi:hypothetical protein
MRPLARIGRLFPRNETTDAVKTRVHFDASPEKVWEGMLFYEEVPGRPAPLLRLFLPAPIRTEGEKTRVGSVIRCTYDGGYLEKRITAAEPAPVIENSGPAISMRDGSYGIRPDAGGTEVVLTTTYRGHLRPRWLWRLLERFLAHRLHRHILDGMRAMLKASAPLRELPAPDVTEYRHIS